MKRRLFQDWRKKKFRIERPKSKEASQEELTPELKS
jgi:hypothetical protein